MNPFKHKVIIITGASSGIGKACAIELAKLGAYICLAARRIEKIDSLKMELIAIGTKAISVKTDVSLENECKTLIDETINTFGKIDILINNAGIAMRSSFEDTDVKVLKKLMDVNFWGAVYFTKFALPYLLEAKGTVVAVSSVAGFQGLPGRIGYSASKYALNGFFRNS